VPQPDISVVITTYQRPRQLAGVLRALARQSYPIDAFEVIVVNDGGTDSLESVLQPFGRDLQLRLLRQPNAGPGPGRNAGVAEARGALIAFTDDDCEPAADWLRTLKSAAEAAPGCLLGGRTIAGFPQVICLVASQMIQDVVYDFYNGQPASAKFFASNNMAGPADLFRSLGGFDGGFRIAAEDRDFCERWRLAGRRMVYIPDAVVSHCHRLTLAGFLRQHFRYGRGAARFHRKRTRRRSSRLRDHVAMYLNWYKWLPRPWREASGSRAARLQLLLLLWQAANIAGFVYGWLFDGGRNVGAAHAG
jgi:GT2 family glycosyltransferase